MIFLTFGGGATPIPGVLVSKPVLPPTCGCRPPRPPQPTPHTDPMTTPPDVPDLDLAVALVRAAELDPTLGIFHALLGLATPEQIIRVSPTVNAAMGLEEHEEPLAAAREAGPWLTIAEAATRAGVSDQTIRRAMSNGLAHTVRPHGRPRYRLRATEVDKYFQPRHH